MIVKRPLIINQPEVGQMIIQIRLLMRLTQEQFAAELGVTMSSISRWERGMNKPLPLVMEKIEGLLRQLGERGQELLEQYATNQQNS